MNHNEIIGEFKKEFPLIHKEGCDVNLRGLQVCNMGCRYEFNRKLTLSYNAGIEKSIEVVEGNKWERKTDPFEHIAEVSYNQAIDDISSQLSALIK
jgi:hypothetical protein